MWSQLFLVQLKLMPLNSVAPQMTGVAYFILPSVLTYITTVYGHVRVNVLVGVQHVGNNRVDSLAIGD